jgi:adenylate cyclase
MSWRCSACSSENPEDAAFCGDCGGTRLGGTTAVVADPVRGLVAAGPAEGATSLRSERRLVTALFADISGFTELTGRVDAEELLEIIDPVVAALGNVVERFGGVVEKYAGDAILALFSAPVAHEDDAARALRTAAAMHRELAGLVPELGPAAANLRLHIGVNSGHGIGRVLGSGVRLDYGVLGDVVVLAQRLEAAAAPGETYVGETTYELARKQFDLEPIGAITVKGKAEPVQAWRLVGPRAESGAVAVSAEPALVGRERELGLLAALVGTGAGVGFVVGEAGAGKTVLCESIRARAENAGLEWLAARCISYGAELAYWPFADLLRRRFGLVGAPHLRALALLEEQLIELELQEAVPFVAALCGVEGAPPTGLGAQSFQVRLHESVLAVFRVLASRQPAVFHLDDLHWADGPTVELLRKVLHLCGEVPLLVLVSARPEAQSTVAELEAAVGGARVRVELEPLAEAAVGDIATAILGAPPSSSLVAELLERTRGNPLFVEEVTRSLSERRELVKQNGEWHTRPGWEADQVPLTVEGILAARIDALGEPERDALEVLSIIGRRADGKLARAVSGNLDAAVPALVGAGLLDPPGESAELAFHHPLIQQVVYSRLLRRRRARLHTLVGEAAERLYGVGDASVDLFARHFYLGEEPQKAYAFLLRAADRAERLYANEQALTHLRRALELVDSGPDRPGLVLRCARLEEIVGRYDEALALYREALETTGDLQASVGAIATLRKRGEYDRAREAIARARAEHPEPAPPEAAALALEEGWLLGLLGEQQRAIDVLEGGLAAIANRDDELEGRLLVVLARHLATHGREPEGLPHAERARLLFERSGDLPRLAMTLRVLGGIQGDLADAEGDRQRMQQARSTLKQAQSLARRVGNAEEQAAALVNLAVILGDLGEYEAALDTDREALAAFSGAGIKAGVACAYCNIADHLIHLARWEEALAAGRQALAVAEEIDVPFWTTGALISISRSELELGNPATAAAAAEQAVELALAHGIPHRARYALRAATGAHEALGDRERVEMLRRQVDELEEQ